MKTSHSSRATFKSCKRKHWYSYTKQIEPVNKSKALRMGTAWALALEHGAPMLHEYYRKEMHSGREWEIDEMSHELRIIAALYATYPYNMGEMREVNFTHVGNGYEDRGQLDGLRNDNDRFVITENKLYSRFGKMEQEKLEFDDQLTSYVTALVDGDVDGFPNGCDLGLVDIEYNVTLKPALRQKVNESDGDFVRRCVDDIYARPGHYHKQYTDVSRSNQAMQDFRERRDKHVMDLHYEERMGVWERNPAACFEYGQCPFLKICRAPRTDDVPDGYRNREERR